MIKTNRNMHPKSPLVKASIPDDSGIYFLKIPIVPKISIAVINCR